MPAILHSFTCAIALFALIAGPTLADTETQQAFDTMFGTKLAAVKQTASNDDDLALAKEMIAATGGVREAPALAEMLNDNAYQIAIRNRGGLAVADQALVGLTTYPKRTEDALSKLVQLRRRIFGSLIGDARKEAGETLASAARTLARVHWKNGDTSAAITQQRQAFAIARSIKSLKADSLQAELNLITAKAGVARRIGQLGERILKSRKDDAAANELATLYLTELDATDEVVALATVVSDPSLQAIAALLAKDDDKLTPADVLAISKWYDELTQSLKRRTAVTARRALEYYQRYVTMPQANNVTRIAAAARIKDLSAEVKSGRIDIADYGIDVASVCALLGGSSDPSGSAAKANFILQRVNKMNLVVGQLTNGSRIANNRTTAWTQVSEGLLGQNIVRSNVRAGNTYIVVADRTTTVHLLIMEVSGTELLAQGWKKSKYTAKVMARGTAHNTASVWIRKLEKGKPLEIRPTGNYGYMLIFAGHYKVIDKP